MAFDVRKTVTDTGYVAIGIGVLGIQQAQVRRREIQKRLGETGGCLGARAQDLGAQVKDRLEPVLGQALDVLGS
jgi:hypothetical protein